MKLYQQPDLAKVHPTAHEPVPESTKTALNPIPGKQTSTTSAKTVINLSDVELTDTQKTVLSRGLNFALPPRSNNNLDIANIESTLQNANIYFKEEIRWKVRTFLREIRSVIATTSGYKRKLRDIHNLRRNKSIKIVQADKGIATVVLHTVDDMAKLQSLITPDKYTLLKRDPTTAMECRVKRLLKKYEMEFSQFYTI